MSTPKRLFMEMREREEIEARQPEPVAIVTQDDIIYDPVAEATITPEDVAEFDAMLEAVEIDDDWGGNRVDIFSPKRNNMAWDK